MGNRLFNSTVIREAQEAMDFMANVLEASTKYSIIGKDLSQKLAGLLKGLISFSSEYGTGSTFVLLLSEH